MKKKFFGEYFDIFWVRCGIWVRGCRGDRYACLGNYKVAEGFDNLILLVRNKVRVLEINFMPEKAFIYFTCGHGHLMWWKFSECG